MTAVERVYIGGFEAGRLSGSEIVDRLKSQLADTIEIQGEVHFGSCFCHIDVVSKTEGASGLDSIVKLYHNVKWKGCKLRVEKARPHLLERLEAERTERKNKTLEEPKPDAHSPVATLPRFLKVKQRHGQECWKVDTRPVEVTDWKRFEKLRAKLLKQNQKSEQQVASTGRKPKPAIHLTFASKTPFNQNINEDAVSDSGMESVFSHSSSSSVDQVTGKYEWSDDDTDHSSTGSSSAGDRKLGQNKPFTEPSMLDEFAPALDASSLVSNGSADDATSASSSSVELDLANEVEMGLNVLSELFPDVGKVAHTIVKQSESPTIGHDGPDTTSNVLVERYDPTQKSAEKYLLTDDVSTQPSPDEASAPLSTKEPEKRVVQDSNGIYDEKKLESVFRAAREAIGAPVPDANATDSTDTFAFGFQLNNDKDPEVKELTKTSTFQFSFSVKDQSGPDATLDEEGTRCDAEDDSFEPAASAGSDAKRRRSMITSDELSKYVGEFFLMGDGEKIRDDLSRYRADEQIRERWLQERKALTLDWKRKRKHAVSRQKSR